METTKEELLVREMLARVADKWTLLVIDALADGELRFSRLRDKVGGVSQKMLTKTLRQLERDGLVTRRVHPVVPPRVDYRLTRLGESLGESVCAIWVWVEKHLREVERSRRTYDGSIGETRPEHRPGDPGAAAPAVERARPDRGGARVAGRAR